MPEYNAVRARSLELCRHLEAEDFVVQSMPDVSPTKWHLAHTTWFFEQFVLQPFLDGYRPFDEAYHYLFNSYYYTAGQMHPRPKRGLLSRPLVREIRNYRGHVDEAVRRLLDTSEDPEVRMRVELGCNHEQQHQELLLTDIKHVFSCHPAGPAVNPELEPPPARTAEEHCFMPRDGGRARIGATSEAFCFDNETPRHEVLIQPHGIGSRMVSNQEYLGFIRDGGYDNHEWWLSDGWAALQQHGWRRPLYWNEGLDAEFTLGGWRDLDRHAPVAHVSFYEADAFASWANARLPTEQEWELSARERPAEGNLLEARHWHPAAAGPGEAQFYGDAWEWTASAYAPYPGFKPLAGALGEYNGKFMCNQMTVRGGSCVTAADHIRPTYRSFFHPDARWQFLGIRLARDAV